MDTGGRQVENNQLTTLSIKRKADEAFDALDDALRTKDSRPSPPKRTNTSIYGSLAKYGIFPIKPKLPSSKVSTPILNGLLSRSRKAKKPTVISHINEPASSFTPEYSPGSTDAFLKRLATYHHSTFSSKPQAIDAVAASKAGWINEGGKDRLYCAICRIGWVLAGREGMTKEAASALVEKQAQQLIDMHKEGCPWRVRQCDPLVYRIPLQSPANLVRQINLAAREIESLLDGIQIRHPLTTNQVQSLIQVVHSIPPATKDTQAPSGTLTPPSSVSLLVSLFGWTLFSPPPPIVRESSASKLARTYSRATSVAMGAPSREGTPAPSLLPLTEPSTPTMNRRISSISQPATPSFNGANSAITAASSPNRPPASSLTQKNAMLQCKLCQRRLGLWAFVPPEGASSSNTTRSPRQLDLLREHRASCPYVAKSTPLPSISFSATPAATPRTSFDLMRSGTSLSFTETSTSAASSAKEGLRRTASFISGLRSSSNGGLSHIRSGSLPAVLHESNLVEGWRAVYNTVMRYGMGERAGHLSRLSTDGVRGGAESVHEDVNEERDNDDAMTGVVELVEQVKRNGGRQLISYVRSLLG